MGEWCGRASQEETMGEGVAEPHRRKLVCQASQEETMGEGVAEPHRRKL